MTDDSAGALARRVGPTLRADPGRTILRPFLPGAELVSVGLSRADSVAARVLDMTEDQVDQALPPLVRALSTRHTAVRAVFRDHADQGFGDGLPEGTSSDKRREMLGAYLTQEYAVEAAAILNPSIVPHPDQTGLAADELRFVLSVRAIGEGHISSLELRTGVVGPRGDVRLDGPVRRLVRPRIEPSPLPADYVASALAAAGASALTLNGSDAHAVHHDVESVVSALQQDGASSEVAAQVRVALESRYAATFRRDSTIAERVLFPASSAERSGIEDVRLLPFEDDDGRCEFRGTYTAYDGRAVASHLMTTTDFRTFTMCRMFGPAARDKGMALFPRRVGGALLSVARRSRETLVIASSTDGLWWDDAGVVQRPRQPWELIQLGTCAPPLQTPEGWLVITHGVGPVRHYAIGAMLLDVDDPLRVRGVLREPLLTPTDEERVGYVPNVVYTCGALVHAGLVVMPYACSDSSIRFATLPLEPLLERLVASPPA